MNSLVSLRLDSDVIAKFRLLANAYDLSHSEMLEKLLITFLTTREETKYAHNCEVLLQNLENNQNKLLEILEETKILVVDNNNCTSTNAHSLQEIIEFLSCLEKYLAEIENNNPSVLRRIFNL
ncbi:MAG: hypothetical protein ACRCTZ_01980 [Sarcina sp.]